MNGSFPFRRAGVTPPNWVQTCDNVEERTTCGRKEVGQPEPCPGGLSLRRVGVKVLLLIPPYFITCPIIHLQEGAGAEPLLLHPPTP